MWEYIKNAAQLIGPSPMLTWIENHNRIELSGVTFINAVSKAANFLVDGLEVEEEQPIYIDLGNHWQSPVWISAVLATGAVVSDVPSGINLVNSSNSEKLNGIVAMVTRDPFGIAEQELPSEVINVSAEVRVFGDYFVPRTSASNETVLSSWGVTAGQGQELAKNFCEEHSIASREVVGIAGINEPHQALNWHGIFCLFNQSPLVLVEGEFNSEKIQQQELTKHFIKLP